MVDNLEIARFLVGGEVAFTTGIGLKKDMKLFDLVKEVYKNNASGMVINIGHYINKIDKEIIDYADEHIFTIFEVPWHVHMADIMKTLCSSITRSEQKIVELSEAFKNAIFVPEMDDLYIPVLMQKGFSTEWTYSVTTIDVCNVSKEDDNNIYSSVDNNRIDIILKIVENNIIVLNSDSVFFKYKNKILIILCNIVQEDAKKLIESLRLKINEVLKKSEVCFIGIGSNWDNIKNISQSYIMSCRIIKMLKQENRENETICYKQLGVKKLLLNIDNKQCIEDFYEDTINYKLKKIESILNVNITKFDTRTQLMIGLMITKIRSDK